MNAKGIDIFDEADSDHITFFITDNFKLKLLPSKDRFFNKMCIRDREKENKIYFEFLDFYECSKVNYIWFSEVGNFPKLQKAVGKKPDEMWSEDDRLLFSCLLSTSRCV